MSRMQLKFWCGNNKSADSKPYRKSSPLLLLDTEMPFIAEPNSRRSKVSGRRFPQHYLDVLPEQIITRDDDIQAINDLRESTRHEHMCNVLEHIESEGYDTPFDFIVEYMETCFHRPNFSPPEKLIVIGLRLASLTFTTEMVALTKIPSLRRPAASFTMEQVLNFSLDSFRNELETTAPTLMSFLKLLVLPSSETSETAEPGFEEDAYDEEDVSQTSSIGELPETTSPRKTRSRLLAILMAMSILLYARNQQINLVPGTMGYFLHCFQTPKRVIECVHRLGVVTGYEFITSGMKSIAEDAKAELKKLAAQLPPMFAFVDNMNFHARVRDQRLDNQAEQQNYTVGYCGLNPYPVEQQMLQREDPTSKLETLHARNLLPTNANLALYADHVLAGISVVLETYCQPSLQKLGVEPYPYTEMYQLPATPTKVFTLPAFDKNEAIIDEMTEVLRLVMQALGYTREHLIDRTMLFGGDYLTIRNVRYKSQGEFCLTHQDLPFAGRWNQSREII